VRTLERGSNELSARRVALHVLELDGVVLLASQSDGCYLGDPLFDDLLAELDRRAAVVMAARVGAAR
jgi:hypothetical protein